MCKPDSVMEIMSDPARGFINNFVTQWEMFITFKNNKLVKYCSYIFVSIDDGWMDGWID